MSHTMFTVCFSSPCRREGLTTVCWFKCFKSRKLSCFKSSDNMGISLTGFKRANCFKIWSTQHILTLQILSSLKCYNSISRYFKHSWQKPEVKTVAFQTKHYSIVLNIRFQGQFNLYLVNTILLMLLYNAVTQGSSPASQSVGVTQYLA